MTNDVRTIRSLLGLFYFMAINKKSFIAYSDWYGMFNALPNEVAGELIKHIFAYVNDENPTSDNFIINALFEQVKATLKRDLVKWEDQREQRSVAGKKSAEIRLTKSNERSNSLNETERKPTVSVSVSVSDSVTDNVKEKEVNVLFEKFWNMYPVKIAKKDCLKKFISLPKKSHDLIFETLPSFIKYKPFESYNHPNPLTYLNKERWNDVIVSIKLPNTQPSLNLPQNKRL
jgi:hypothetical protein